MTTALAFIAGTAVGVAWLGAVWALIRWTNEPLRRS